MKKFIFAFFSIPITIASTLCILNCAYSQNPLVKMWDTRFGGTSIDASSVIIKSADRGYLVAGWSVSGINGDKSQNTWGNTDYWIIRMDSAGNKLWDKDFGGTGEDDLYSAVLTSDGGYLLSGYSASGISGDKTYASWNGTFDYWVLRTDSMGNKLWDRSYGGTGTDALYTSLITTDSGFLFGGISDSPVSGDKTQNQWGAFDYWMVKTNSSGVKIWDKDFGGTDREELKTVIQTTDGGYLLGGMSRSGIGGDKTEASKGAADYWIVKTDSSGNKQWDKDYGGNGDDYLSSVLQTEDGGYFLSGWSQSGAGGDKSQNCWGGFNDVDYWLIKIDSLGNKIWDKDYGGVSGDGESVQIIHLRDGGYLLSGDSYSPVGGDKTENCLGLEQTWIIKIDSVGNKLWDKTALTPGHDEISMTLEASDGCYVLTNSSTGGIGGDKSQACWGFADYWIVKFCDSTALPLASLSSDNFICPGTCINFINLSAYAGSYQWSFQGATPGTSTDINPVNICYANPGSYDVQLIAANANGSDTLLLSNYITVYPSPSPQSITQSGDTLFAIAGSASYQWYFNANIINGATDYFYVAPASGDYNVVATDANGCEVEAAVFNVVADLQSTVDSGQLTIFPNPVGDKVIIHPDSYRELKVTSETAVEISVYNVLGEKIYATTCVEPLTVNCEPFPPGLYYLEITSSGKTFRTKFVKQ